MLSGIWLSKLYKIGNWGGYFIPTVRDYKFDFMPPITSPIKNISELTEQREENEARFNYPES